MSLPHSSPKKLRPFVPLVSLLNRRSISPPPDILVYNGTNSPPLPASSGMFLLVRNVLPDNKSGFGKPDELVREAIDEICNSDEGKELSEITLDVMAGGHPQDLHRASAYIELAREIKKLYPLPRPDLLTDWLNALTKSRPNWEIVWAPQKKGRDRRMTVRFRVAESKEKVPANSPDRIRAYLESKDHKTIGGYISFDGRVNIIFADTHSVDTILASRYYLIPTLSRESMHVSPLKSIPINNPFELCIGGLNKYEGLHDIIEEWLYQKYTYDDIAKTTRVFDTRISSDHDYFIFAMDSWESTVLVLGDSADFRTYFTHSPLLTDPKLLFELNSTGFASKSIVTTINAGAEFINDIQAITDLKRDLTDLRKEQSEIDYLVQRQVASILPANINQTNNLKLIGDQVHQFGLYLLAERDEKVIEGRMLAIDNNLMFEMQCLRTTNNENERLSIKSNISTLQNERREQARLLVKVSDIALKLIGPAPSILSIQPSLPSGTLGGY